VPFGERLPLEEIFGGIYRLLNLDVTNYQAGSQTPSLNCNGVSIAIAICFEVMFAQNHWKNDFDVLININEEGWYYNTLAPQQRIQYARMRAVEHARPVISMSNNGPSAIIDHRGKIVFATSSDVGRKYEAFVQGRSGSTPYHRYGAWMTLSLLIVMIALSIMIRIFKNLPVGIK
jgi:apolipoprotein N-acyltransferase